jgi:bisphosphoglycerate-dependent phosphoglycerate mutase
MDNYLSWFTLYDSKPNDKSPKSSVETWEDQWLKSKNYSQKVTDTLRKEFPKSESVKDVAGRAHKYWVSEVAPSLKTVEPGAAVLISSHPDVFKGLIKKLGGVKGKKVMEI